MNIKKNSLGVKTFSYLITFSIAILLLLYMFQNVFLKIFYEKAKAEDEASVITKDLDAFLNGHAYGYGTHFCLLRYGR